MALGALIGLSLMNGLLSGIGTGLQYDAQEKARQFQEKMAKEQAALQQEAFNAQQDEMNRQIEKEQQTQQNISDATGEVLFGQKKKKKPDEIFAPDAFSNIA